MDEPIFSKPIWRKVYIEDYFIIKRVDLGENPKELLDNEVSDFQKSNPYKSVPENWLPEYHLERYLEQYVIIGSYHNQGHWDWITGKNDKSSLIYNVRLDQDREGALTKSEIKRKNPIFAILYEERHEHENNYHVFRIHDHAEMSADRMIKAEYPGTPKGKYYIFRFDEEITLGKLDIHKLISATRINEREKFTEYAPLFKQCKELIEYRLE